MLKAPSKTAFALLLAVSLAACSPFYVDWQNRTIRTTPPIEETPAAPATTVTTYTSHRQTASLPPKKHRQPANPDMEEMSIEPETAEPAPPATTTTSTTISMVAPGDTSGAVERSLDATSQRLAHFDRSRLSGSTLATFDQANGFLSQGRQALTEKDYVAASGFAQKASAFAAQLQPTSSASR